MKQLLSLGYSPCPNDTFIFYALVHGLIPVPAHPCSPPLLEDVETLNAMAMQARLDITKLSFHALGHTADQYRMLTSGAALGRGCGPLLVTAGTAANPRQGWKVAIPGQYTTAALLLRLFAPECKQLIPMRFEQIIPAVARGAVDAGLIIHESRFTYQETGLRCVQDLGLWWEEETGLPLPLGCIAAKRSLGESCINTMEKAIRDSLLWARQHPQECLPYIRSHAQELDSRVINSHIGLYVNDFSLDIGDEGRLAVTELFRRAREQGIFPGMVKQPWL